MPQGVWSTFIHPQWQLCLELPAPWNSRLEGSAAQSFLLAAAPAEEAGCIPHVSVRRLTADGTASQDHYLDQLVPALMCSENGFQFYCRSSLVNPCAGRCPYIEYTSMIEGAIVQSRSCIVALHTENWFLFTAASAAVVWNRYRIIFERIVASCSGETELNSASI